MIRRCKSGGHITNGKDFFEKKENVIEGGEGTATPPQRVMA
jgi:hypothetical protein